MVETEFTSASFYRFLSEKRLMAAKCKGCQALYLPPRPICFKCRVADMEWVRLKGEGKLIAFTTIAVGTSPMAAEGYDRNRHYCCGIVELDEGPKVSALVVGVDPQVPGNIKIGTQVRIEFVDRQDKPAVLTFKMI